MDQSNFTFIRRDVQREYVAYRKKGLSRDEAIASMRERYTDELEDEDDRIAVLAGLVYALAKQHELFESIANETHAEIQCIRQCEEIDKSFHTHLNKLEEKLQSADAYGEEAVYAQIRTYNPSWVVGDVLAHTMTCPEAEELGIMGCIILFYKIGDHLDDFGEYRHLMLVSLCAPNNLPSCYDDLRKIGFLPMMGSGNSLEYLGQIGVKSKRGENTYDLTKIGHYPNPHDPALDEYLKENPLTAMPLFGRLKRNDLLPAYEDLICGLYRKYRKIYDPLDRISAKE